MLPGKEDDAAADEAKRARREEAQRQARIRGGTDSVNQIFGDSFSDDFFGGIRTDFTDYAMPEVDRQYNDASKELAYALTRAGTLDSSARAESEAELLRQKEDAVRGVGNQALDYENKARTDVESARADLIRTLSATGDVDGAVSDALSRARTSTYVPSFSPIGQLFTTGAGALAQQMNEERTAAVSDGAYKPRFDTGLYKDASKSVKVT